MQALEQTLFLCREVDVYKIPPRHGAAGHRSGDWCVADRLATVRLKVVAQDDKLEVRLEDTSTGELFGVCPVPRGQAHVAVEQASDSSRNFVLRLEDVISKRHAFIGISFTERPQAFDFNVALADFEKQQRREVEIGRIAAAADPLAAAQTIMPEAAALYMTQDLRLKEGETIKIDVKKKSTDGDSFLSRLGTSSASSSSGSSRSGAAPRLVALAPPPGDSSAGRAVLPPLPKPAPAPVAAAPPKVPAAAAPATSGADDLLGLGDSAANALAGFQPFAAAPAAPTSTPAAAQPATEVQPSGWATFD